MNKRQLLLAKKYLEKYKSLSNSYGKNSKMYRMTTENISDFLNNYDLKDKSVLTVAGSGDQRLNALLFGAKNVTCFDVNPLTKFQLELKDSVIKNVSLEEFLYFFGLNHIYGIKEFDQNIFKKLSLKRETYDFFNYIINENIYLNTRNIYFDMDDDLAILKGMNNYLDLDEYNKLSKILKNHRLNFICSDVKYLPKIIKDKYDFILLSNISDYIHKIYEEDSLLKYRELIDKLIESLNDYGILQVGYIYSRYGRGEDVSLFHINKNRNDYFPNNIFHSCFVSSYYNDGTYDKIITYQKLPK